MATVQSTPEDAFPFPFGISFFPRAAAKTAPVDESSPHSTIQLFLLRPLYAPLLFNNVSSDARDHCANERTFLAWLRISIYLAIVAVAILVNFHLKRQPSELEQRLSLPLGIIFGLLSAASLTTGVGIYMRTVTKYAHRRAMVQHGIKTQAVFAVLTLAIMGSCGLFLGVDALEARSRPNRR
ncbi:hypothetical protein DV737_g1007, partial [Chaetothyriales sp. CBS 132003]